MAAVCTPVTVITALHEGQPFGTTVSAFASLSLDPPMVLVSLDRSSDLLATIREVGEFGVNVLSSQQAATAVRFARKGGTAKFVGVLWQPESGVPRLPGSCCFLVCTVAGLVDGGDHIIVLGQVTTAESTGGAPLTYHRRTFGTHMVLPRRPAPHRRVTEAAIPAPTAHAVSGSWPTLGVEIFLIEY